MDLESDISGEGTNNHTHMPLELSCLPLQPLHRSLVPLEKPLRLLHNLFMILIDPLPLLHTQQPNINQLPTHGHHGHVFKAQIRLISKTMLRVHFPGHDDVLDPDTEIAVFIVSRLIGQHVPGREGNLAVLNTRADSDGTLVDVEVRAHAVAGTVAIVETFLPEELAGQGVQGEPAGAFGKHGGVESYDAFQDQSVRFAFHVCGRAEMEGSRRVGCAVQVLSARVAEVDSFRVDDGAVAWLGFIVDDCGVGAGGGDGVEGKAGEVVLFPRWLSYQK